MEVYTPSKKDLGLAAKILQEQGIVKENTYPEVFDGYVSSFGASIAQSGLLPTLINFESQDSEAKYRCALPHIILLFLIESKWINPFPKTTSLSMIVSEEKDALRKNKIARCIENASVAFKIALRMYRQSDEAVIEDSAVSGLSKSASFNPASVEATKNMGYEFQFRNQDITTWRDFKDALSLNSWIVNSLKGFQTFKATVKAPGLLIGMGLSHGIDGSDIDFKAGMQFDRVSGFPVLPGSSVKGILKSYFKDFAPKYVKENVDLAKLEKEIFETGIPGPNGSVKRDIFADAIVCSIPSIGVVGKDYITPHTHPLKEPKPIKILKVLPGVQFEFCFKLYPSDVMEVESKIRCFKEILRTVGIGAKTNVGYGRLKI